MPLAGLEPVTSGCVRAALYPLSYRGTRESYLRYKTRFLDIALLCKTSRPFVTESNQSCLAHEGKNKSKNATITELSESRKKIYPKSYITKTSREPLEVLVFIEDSWIID